MKQFLVKSLKVLATLFAVLYIAICVLFYVYQEKAYLFFPQKLAENHTYSFDIDFEEIPIKTADDLTLNSLLFKADTTKGLIFYLHGNGGSLDGWGKKASFYTQFGYDIFMIDYRGYGKSQGAINNEEQLHNDVQLAYNEMKKRYAEDNITVLGYSLGSGLATKLVSQNNPKRLILQAPYYNINDASRHLINTSDNLMLKTLRIFPTSLLNKYSINSNEFIQKCNVPITIFHGKDDELIYYGSSVKLKEHLKPNDTLITLEGQNHWDFVKNEEYKSGLKKVLQ